MTEQERELFERRSLELAQARRVIDDLRARYVDVSKALSHVLHDNEAKDARIADLEAQLVVWKANDAQARRDWNADKEAASKVLDVMGELTELSTPEEAARDLVEKLEEARQERDAALNAQEAAEKEVFALRAKVSELEAKLRYAATHAAERRKQSTDMLGKLPTERSARARELYMTADEYDGSMNERYVLAEEFERLLGGVNDEQAASNPPATPAIDESGEPAAYDVADKHWPAVGERTTEDVAWDHCMACPEARYVFTSPWSRERFPVKAGKHPRTGNPCLLNDPPESRSSPSFTSVRGDNNSAWVVERAPDAAPENMGHGRSGCNAQGSARPSWFIAKKILEILPEAP